METIRNNQKKKLAIKNHITEIKKVFDRFDRLYIAPKKKKSMNLKLVNKDFQLVGSLNKLYECLINVYINCTVYLKVI